MKLYDRQRQTIHDTLAVLGDIQSSQDHLPYAIESLPQAASTPIEATLGRDHGKQITMLLPMAEHFSFHIPAATLANQGHRQQFTIRTLGRRPRSLEKRSYLEPNNIYHLARTLA